MVVVSQNYEIKSHNYAMESPKIMKYKVKILTFYFII